MEQRRKAKRIYIHFSGETEDLDHTFVLYSNNGVYDGLENIKTAFLSDYQQTFPDSSLDCSLDQYMLKYDKRKLTEDILPRMKNKADVFIEPAPGSALEKKHKQRKQESKTETKNKPVSVSAKETPVRKQVVQEDKKKEKKEKKEKKKKEKKKKEKKKEKKKVRNTLTDGGRAARQIIDMAQQKAEAGNKRKAWGMYEEVIRMVGNGNDAASIYKIATKAIGEICLYSKQYDKAIKYFLDTQKAVERATEKQSPAEDAQLCKLLGQAYLKHFRFEKARATFDRGIRILNKLSQPDPNELHDIMCWKARAMYDKGDKQEGLNLFMEVLHRDQDFVHALAYYGKIAVDHKQASDAIPNLLRALIAPKEKYKVEKQITDLVHTSLAKAVDSVGSKKLLKELNSAANSPPALVFLAQTIKHQGCIPEAIDLYERATQKPNLHGPDKAEIILNLIHTLEVAYRYQKAVDWTRDYFSQNKSFKVGDTSIGEFYDIVKDLSPVGSDDMKMGTASCPKYVKPPVIFDAGKCQVKVPGHNPVLEKKKKEVAEKGKYSDTELNMLALMVTFVKLMYVTGCLQTIPACLHLIEPLRLGRELHTTSMRNEHAYYCCIAQVMREIPFPIMQKKVKKDVIYMCADSHSLSSAWQTLKIKGRKKPVLIVPKLVTGLKCWNLRENTRFFPKKNFEAAMKTIPDRSEIIFGFGEIDCREGILMAVEKCKYESVEEGMNTTIEHYLKALTKLGKKRGFKIYIQPVVPVLDVTRQLVKQFNSLLTKHLRKHKTIQHLDFFQDLLDPRTGGFNMKYALDGTHMSPSYCPLLEKTLANGHKLDRKGKDRKR